MIPYLLAVVGGYFVAQSRKSETFADGGNISETATTILSQLGGAGKLHAITGAHTFVDLKNGLAFRLPNPRANWVKILLNGKDLYDIEVGRIRGTTYKVVARGEDIYFDEMKPFIEQATGLTLTMPRVRFDDGGVATEQMVVTFGKHSGKTIDEIFATDRGWVKWFVEKYKTEPFIDFKGNSRMPKLTEQDIAMKEQARELLAKNPIVKSLLPEKTRDKSVSNYIGRIGDRVTILATVVHIGPSTIFFKDERGNVFYIYDKSFDISGKEGEMFKVTGTVTKQWDKAGEKVTYLNRAKVEKYKKPADWMYMKDGGSVGDPRFTFKTFDEYDYAKRGGYFDFNTVEVDAVDEKGMERFFQPKSEEEYLKIITDGRYKIIQETPVELYFDIQEYYDPEDPEEREYEYEYQDEYKKGGKVGKLKKLRDAS